MSLIAWFPFNGNLDNKGLCGNVTAINSGAIIDNNGKIGKCYSFTINQYMELSNIPYSSLSTASICFWIKIPQDDGNWLPFTGQTTSYYILATSNGTGGFYHQSIGSNTMTIYCDGVVRTSPINDGNWHHYCITNVNLSSWTRFLINNYGGTGGTWNWNGKFNDLRIYDHCLSAREVKEISKGLVLHYTLDDEYVEATINISQQGTCSGWNNSGSATWNNNETSIPDIPEYNGKTVSITQNTEGQSAITFGQTLYNVPSRTLSASTWFYISGDPTSSIPPYIRSSQSDGNVGYLEYKGSTSINSWPRNTWIKISKTFTTSSSETKVYFCAYSAKAGCKFTFNGWQIEEKDHATPYTPNSRGFRYDTNIYIEPDGSKWARIAHHNNPANAKFSSEDDFANGVYKDADRWFDVYQVVKRLNSYEFMVKQKDTSSSSEMKFRWIQYTSPLTASYSQVAPGAVNRITTSGYTDGGYGGIYILNSGTHICIANYSNGNWWGAIGCWSAYSDGIPGYPSYVVSTGYIDLYVRIDTDELPYVYDSSGYGNNGTITGTLGIEKTSLRYQNSLKFNGSNYISTQLQSSEFKTVSLWAYIGSSIPTYNILFADYKSKLSIGFYSNQIITSCSGEYNVLAANSLVKTNQWNHFCVVKGSSNQLYINGQAASMSGSNYWNHNSDILMIGRRYDATDGFINAISDFRIYATALSADDVRDLYNTPAIIDNTGNFFGYDMIEDNPGSRELGPYPTSDVTWLSDGSYKMSGRIWPPSDYIRIYPTGKTYYYDIEYSNVSGNSLWIGFEKYDINYGTGGNQECQYLVADDRNARNHYRITGTINLSSANGNTAAYTRLRLLNDWYSQSGSSMQGTIHHISLKECTSTTSVSINKTGEIKVDDFIESPTVAAISKPGNLICNHLEEL